MEKFVSDLSKKEFPASEKISAKTIRRSVMSLIQKDHPDFGPGHFISDSELNLYREKYISEYLSKEIGDLTELEQTVLKSLSDQSILSDRSTSEDGQTLTFGQRVADSVATFGGSWTFIISFGVFLAIWVLMNVFWIANRRFDPYPFILLNLILSCIAAMQAPVIMMSQNRQEEKDRERARNDYMINLKSELEIRTLHEKMDHLIIHQEQEMLELQKVQIEMMVDILDRLEKK
jgi:uncharacterized membrane protein